MRLGRVVGVLATAGAMLVLAGCPSNPGNPAGSVLRVTTLLDILDGDVTSVDALVADPGPDQDISLREALLAVNASGGNRTIRFDVSGTIGPLTDLPELTASRVTIDGQNKIVLDGGLRSGLGAGVTIRSASNLVRDLTVQRFPGDGIVITGALATDNQIQGCRIGTNGSAALRNGKAGVRIELGASNNRIGGTAKNTGNIISGNETWGVAITGASAGGSKGNHVQGNYIGSNDVGNVAIPNKLGGIQIADSSENVIGGTNAILRNVITGNTGPGIEITGSIKALAALENVIQGNFIGTNALGGSGPGNVVGVRLSGQVFDTLIGGISNAEGNAIAGNTDAGISITTGASNTIRRNSIFDNNGTGIVLTNEAANDGMPAPVISKLIPVTGKTEPNAIVELYIDADGEGGLYGFTMVADAQGKFTKELNFDNFAGKGLGLTATATDSDGNTSEFSAPRAIP